MIFSALLHIKNFNNLYLDGKEYSLLGLNPQEELPEDKDLNIVLVRKLIRKRNENIKSLIRKIRPSNAIEPEVLSSIITIEKTLEGKVGRIPNILSHIENGKTLVSENKSIQSGMLQEKWSIEYKYLIVFPVELAIAQKNLYELNQNLKRICKLNSVKNEVYENLNEVYENLQDIHLLINAYCEYFYEFYTLLPEDFRSIKNEYFKTNLYALLKQKNQATTSEQDKKETQSIANVDQKDEGLKKPSTHRVFPAAKVGVPFYPYKDIVENVYMGNADLAFVEDSELENEIRDLKIVPTRVDITENKPNTAPDNEIFIKLLNDLITDLQLNSKKRMTEGSLFKYGIKNRTLANHRNALVTQLLIVLKTTLNELNQKPDATSITFVNQEALLTLILDAHKINNRMTAQFARFFDSKGSLNTLLETNINTLRNLKL